MFVLIITFLSYGDPIQGHFSPFVSSIDFNTEASCIAARDGYVKAYKPIADELNHEIADDRKVGEIKGAAGISITAICAKK